MAWNDNDSKIGLAVTGKYGKYYVKENIGNDGNGEGWERHTAKSIHPAKNIQCLSPAKNYKLYKSSLNKSIHFVQRSLSSSTRVQVQRGKSACPRQKTKLENYRGGYYEKM